MEYRSKFFLMQEGKGCVRVNAKLFFNTLFLSYKIVGNNHYKSTESYEDSPLVRWVITENEAGRKTT